MTTITLNTNNPKVIQALKAIIECFEVEFKISDHEEKQVKYSKRLLDNIEKADEERKTGKLTILDPDNIWASI
jgi:4-aminobutyrate aminotransferase-like enzyme